MARAVNLAGAKLTKGSFAQADLTGADLSEADLSETQMYRTKLNQANLRPRTDAAASGVHSRLAEVEAKPLRVEAERG